VSVILDALKRSERARRVLGAASDPPPAAHAAPARRGWALGAVALLLVLNGALLAWFVWREPAPPTAAVGVPQGEVRPLSREAGAPPRPAPGALAVGPVPDPAPAAPASDGAVPLADADPALRARLATLHVDVHGWADDPTQRFVLINLKRRTVGDALDGGATLVEIVPEGAVVELDGQRVLLPRQ
jgi:hypothetical protein